MLYGPNTVRQPPKIRAENPIENPIGIRTPKSTENRPERRPRIGPKSAEIHLGRHFRCLGTQNGASGTAFRKNIEIRSDSGTPLDGENEVFASEWLKFALFGRTPKSHHFGLHFRSFSGPRSAMMPTLGAPGAIFGRKCRV